MEKVSILNIILTLSSIWSPELNEQGKTFIEDGTCQLIS